MHERKHAVQRRLVCVIAMVAILLCLMPTGIVKADENKELNIYAMYLGDEDKGDSVLLESKGHYLLVDIGAAAHAGAIVNQLNKLGATHVDIMFSHLHNDHIGGNDQNVTAGLEQLQAAGIVIDTLYLPATNLAYWSQRFPQRYSQIQSFIQRQGSGRIAYLSVGATLQFGDVTGKVVGPVDPWKRSPSQYTKYSSTETRYITYENDSSLAVIFTCGNTRYFTAGDCYGEEAKELVEKYGNDLRCDIMKLCHHGIGTGNSADLLAAIRPKFSFVPNSGVDNVNVSTGRWRSYTATKRASQYGMCYLIGSEKKTLIYHIVNDKINLYQGDSVVDGKKMTGWQYLYGADGANRDHDMYFLGSDCKPAKGVKKIGNHYYRFKPGGQMDYGSYSADGTYNGWKAFTKGERYYLLSENGEYAYMCCGLEVIDGELMYFNEEGFLVTGDVGDGVELMDIDSDCYAVDASGVLTVSDWEIVDDMFYYFDNEGKMLRDCKYKIDDAYYLFDENGVMLTGDYGTEFYDMGTDTYAVRKDGTLVAGKRGKIGSATYYFDAEGVMQKDKIVQIGTKLYYFDKNGKMVCDRNFKLNGKKYHSNAKGVVSAISL